MKRSRTLLLALLGLATLTLLVPAIGSAAKQKHKKKDAKITVMTRNLYLGADLGPAVNAASPCEAIDAAGQIVKDVDASDFPTRAKLLAAEIKKAKPDLLGLQEVALWRDQVPSDYPTGPVATNVRYDFLKLLRKQLQRRGAKYRLVVVQKEFDQELPANTDGVVSGDDGLCGADMDGRLTMRDVIMVRKGSGVKAPKKRADKGNFDTTYDIMLGGVIPISVDRGWTSVEAKVKRTKRTKAAKFRFVNTHLESFGDPQIREDQARELFAKGGPLRTKKQVVMLGDINSGSKKDKIGPPWTNPGDRGAYGALVRDGGMINLGARQTCCYPDVFRDEIGSYRFDHTVDHVMVKPRIRQLRAYVTGDNPNVTKRGLVSSDHGGLVSKLKLKKRR